MTVAELHTAFKFGFDKLDSLGYVDLEDEEIDLLLNQAQDRFIKQRYGIVNNKRQSFEETQKRTDDLKNVVINAILTPAANASDNKPNGRFVTLPSTVTTNPTTNIPYWFSVQEECTLTYTDIHGDSVTSRVRVKPIQHDDYNEIINDPFNKPDKNTVLRLMENGRIELIPSSDTTIGSYYLRYIKRPVRISLDGSVNCELSEHTHQEIVDLAIQIALENVEAVRQQTFPQILNTQE